MRLAIPVGAEYKYGGIAAGLKSTGYCHKVRIQGAGEVYETTVVFGYDISMAMILGEVGFFRSLHRIFDWTTNPPSFELQRIARN